MQGRRLGQSIETNAPLKNQKNVLKYSKTVKTIVFNDSFTKYLFYLL